MSSCLESKQRAILLFVTFSCRGYSFVPENSDIPYHPEVQGGEECLGNHLRLKEEVANRNNKDRKVDHKQGSLKPRKRKEWRRGKPTFDVRKCVAHFTNPRKKLES